MRSRWAKVVAIVLVVLVAAELGTRAIEGHLPPHLDWLSAEAQKKVGQMDALARSGGASIVFIGSSIVRSGIEPAIVTDQLPGHPIAYNAGLAAGVPVMMEPWTLDVVLPRLHPKALVIGISSFDFSDDPSNVAFYDAYKDAPAARRSMGLDDTLDHIDRWLTDRSALWRDRDALRSPSTVLDAIRGKGPPPDPDTAGIEANGRDAYLQEQQFDERNPLAGGVPVGSWKLGTKNVAALQRIIGAAKAQGIAVALVDMPVTDEYIAKHPHRDADYATYLTAARQFAATAAVPLLEFDTTRDHMYFADEVHLNRNGAYAFTPQLVDALQRAGVLAELP